MLVSVDATNACGMIVSQYLNRWVLNGGEIGDFDSFCSLALDLYREAETHRHAMLRNLFMEADDNGKFMT